MTKKYSKMSENEYNKEIIKRLNRLGKINYVKAALFEALVSVWRNPFFNFSLSAKADQWWLVNYTHNIKWNQAWLVNIANRIKGDQIWLINIAEKVNKQYGVLWTKTKEALKQIIVWPIWIQEAEKVNEQKQYTLLWGTQRAGKVWKQKQVGIVNIWTQITTEDAKEQVREWLINIWFQSSNVVEEQRDEAIINFWVQNTKELTGKYPTQVRHWEFMEIWIQWARSIKRDVIPTSNAKAPLDKTITWEQIKTSSGINLWSQYFLEWDGTLQRNRGVGIINQGNPEKDWIKFIHWYDEEKFYNKILKREDITNEKILSEIKKSEEYFNSTIPEEVKKLENKYNTKYPVFFKWAVRITEWERIIWIGIFFIPKINFYKSKDWKKIPYVFYERFDVDLSYRL